ncbi:MAG: hypothetical protein N3B16_03485, partial [Candidatus Aminicenantes bacterium]|nr:hypothetical protein [Candidatus Aminicenantes bacterium]
LRVGASWYDGRWPQPINSSHLRRRQGLEAQWQSRNLLLTAELIKSFDYDHEAKGWVVLASLFLSQGRIQPIFRYESLDRDVTLGNDDEKIITYGLNWHLAPRTKFQINQELHRPKTDKKRNIFLIQFQIGF